MLDPEGNVIEAKFIAYDYETGFGLIKADKLLDVAPLKLGSLAGLKQGGPGQKGQLQAGDIILKVNRQPVTGQADFYRKVWALGSAGVKVPISILRETEI